MLSGRAVDLAAAAGRAAEILARSRAPVFMLAADVAGTRAALRLADRIGAVVDHPRSAGLFRALRPLQDAGALTTTLGEIRNRADVVLIVGPDPTPVLPRFLERCIAPGPTLFSTEPLQRAVFRVGPAAPTPLADGFPITELACANEQLPDAVAVLAAHARTTKPTRIEAAGLDSAGLAAIAERLRAARYAVILWTPALIETSGAELLGQALLELARTLTRTTRCSVLPLGGNGNLFGVNQVTLWQTGYPIRTSLGGGAPDYDPYRFSAERMLADGEADALLWASPLDEAAPPTSVPTILIAPPAASRTPAADVYIPVGVPGLDHAGQVFRTDGVVALHLSPVRAAALPPLASVLAEIERRLPAGGPAA
jgi:formylmethanofuran dehydrogenase subunit B